MLLMLLVNGSGHTAIHGVFTVIATAIAVRYGGLPTFLITTTGVCTCILMFTAVFSTKFTCRWPCTSGTWNVTGRYMSEPVRSNRYCALRPNTAMKLGLVEALLKEQEEALSTAQRCQTQITRLVKEQAQLQSLQQSTDHKGKRHKEDLTSLPEEPSDEELLQALRQHEQDTVGQQQPSAATHNMTTAPGLPIPGLKAYHICPAMHLDGSGKCLMLLPYPRTWQAHCPCGHSQAAGNGVLVLFWLSDVQHVCITTIPNMPCYQRTSQQLGEPAPYTKHIAQRLASTSVHSTARRSARHDHVDVDITVRRDGNMCILSQQVLQALAHLTWDEIVLASSRPGFKV